VIPHWKNYWLFITPTAKLPMKKASWRIENSTRCVAGIDQDQVVVCTRITHPHALTGTSVRRLRQSRAHINAN